MGVDADKARSAALAGPTRSKPPPIPPRPQHLAPAKTMAKYSSMPDVLNGWRRDPNPDLLKVGRGDCAGTLQNGAGSAVSAKISALDVATPRHCARQNGAGAVVREVNGSAQQLYDAKLACAYRDAARSRAVGAPAPAKKLSCIPSFSHSKKKWRSADCAEGGAICAQRPEISQTNWYPAAATINRSKSSSTSPAATLASTAAGNSAASEAPSRSKFSFFRKFRPGNGGGSADKGADHRKKAAVAGSAPCISGPLPSAPFFASLNGPPPTAPSTAAQSAYASPPSLASFSSALATSSPIASSSVTRPPPLLTSSPALARLPPLPKCFTEASPLWDPPENKKVSSHSVNLSPSSSCASSSSRSTSRSTSSGGYPKVPLQSSSSSRSGSVGFDGAPASGKSPAAAATGGDSAPRSDRRPMPPPPPPPPPRKPTSLDIKLATLRKEMQDLRQMDLTLLSQLWSLNEAITEFRHMQVCLSPDCPSVHSSDDDEEDDSGCYYSNLSSQGIVTNSNNQQSNTLGSSSSRSSASTNRSRETTKPR